MERLIFFKMNLSTIYKTKQFDNLLNNGNWQKADYYTLETCCSFWNQAIIISLPKAFAKNNVEALI